MSTTTRWRSCCPQISADLRRLVHRLDTGVGLAIGLTAGLGDGAVPQRNTAATPPIAQQGFRRRRLAHLDGQSDRKAGPISGKHSPRPPPDSALARFGRPQRVGSHLAARIFFVPFGGRRPVRGRMAAPMQEMDLLRKYAQDKDQQAFAELVRLHGDWVYSSARRRLGDEHLAEDVTQAVFLLLAGRARRLGNYAYLAGWLFTTLCYCVKELKRHRSRQRLREQEVAKMRREEGPPEATWQEIAPVLDEALTRLPAKDRDAVLLRFYQQKPLAEVGIDLGVSEEAAKKRVQRALEKLRGMLAKKGVTAGLTGLGVVLAEKVTEAAPAGLVKAATAGAAAGAGGNAIPAGAIARKAAAGSMLRAKLLAGAIVTAAILAVTATTAYIAVTGTHPKAGPASISAPSPVGPATSGVSPKVAPALAAASDEPPLGAGPVSSVTVPGNPACPDIRAVEFIGNGSQVARASGTLNRDDQNHYTGETYLDMYDLASDSTALRGTTSGFPCFNAAFSADGHRAIYSTIDWNNAGHHFLGLADLAEGGSSMTPLETGSGWINALAITRDGDSAASTNGSSVDIWDLTHGLKTKSIEAGTLVGVLSFDRDGRWMLTGAGRDGDSSVSVWDLASSKPLARCTGHTGHVVAVAVAPSNAVAATADSDGAIWMWSLPDGRALARLECPWETIEKLVFSPDSQRLLAATNQRADDSGKEPWMMMVRLRLWDVASGIPLIKFETKGWAVDGVAFAGNGQEIVTSQRDHAVCRWALPAGLMASRLAEGARRAPPAATQPSDGQIRCFDFAAGGWSLAFSRDGKHLYAGGMNRSQSWNLGTGEATPHSDISGVLRSLNTDLNRGVADSSKDELGFAVLYELSTGRRLLDIAPEGFPYIDAMDFSASGKLLALAGGCMKERRSPVFTPRLELFRLSDGGSACRIERDIDSIRALKFSPDSKRLYVASGWRDAGGTHDCVIRALDAQTGEQQRSFAAMTEVPKAMAISDDGRRLWAAGEWGSLDCWDTASGRAILHVGPFGQAFSLALSPEGATVAVGLADHNIILLDAQTGHVQRRLRRHQGIIMALAFSPDSTRLASTGTDGTVRVWDMKSQESGR